MDNFFLNHLLFHLSMAYLILFPLAIKAGWEWAENYHRYKNERKPN